VVGVRELVATGAVAWGTALQAVAFAIGFHVWAAWNHKRRAMAQAPADETLQPPGR